MRERTRNQSSNPGQQPTDSYLDEVHERYGDRDTIWERLLYVGAYLVATYVVYRLFDLRGVGVWFIITAVVVVLMLARTALVSILAIGLGLLGLVVYSHIVWQFL